VRRSTGCWSRIKRRPLLRPHPRLAMNDRNPIQWHGVHSNCLTLVGSPHVCLQVVCRKLPRHHKPASFSRFLRAPRDHPLDHSRSGAHGPPDYCAPMSRRSISGGCQLDIENTEFLPGALHACSGRPRGSLRSRPRTDAACRFGGDHQIVEVSQEPSERYRQREQAEIRKALQLDFPSGRPGASIRYVQMDGTGVRW